MGMDKSLGVTLADRQYWTIIFKLQFKNRYLPQKWVFLFRIWYSLECGQRKWQSLWDWKCSIESPSPATPTYVSYKDRLSCPIVVVNNFIDNIPDCLKLCHLYFFRMAFMKKPQAYLGPHAWLQALYLVKLWENRINL